MIVLAGPQQEEELLQGWIKLVTQKWGLTCTAFAATATVTFRCTRQILFEASLKKMIDTDLEEETLRTCTWVSPLDVLFLPILPPFITNVLYRYGLLYCSWMREHLCLFSDGSMSFQTNLHAFSFCQLAISLLFLQPRKSLAWQRVGSAHFSKHQWHKRLVAGDRSRCITVELEVKQSLSCYKPWPLA